MYIQELVLEVTRRCNMRCEHCMRGGAQSKNMSRDIIDKVLESVTSIGCVVFTGGEPTLNVSIIRYFTQQAMKRKINISYFYIVTNGKIQSMSLMKALIDLYAYCDEKDVCSLMVSGDQFHERCETSLYEAFLFYDNEARKRDINMEGVINEGRAKDNGIGYREIKIPKFDTCTRLGVKDEEINQVMTLVYISSNGNVISECDLSYDRIDRESFGNIMTEDLASIIGKNMEEVS